MLVVGHGVRLSCVEEAEESGDACVAFRCFRPRDVEAARSERDLRWTVRKSVREVKNLILEVASISETAAQTNELARKVRDTQASWWQCCSTSKTQLGVEVVVVEAWLNDLMKKKGVEFAKLDQLLSEFLEISVLSIREEYGFNGKFIEGYLDKNAVVHRDERVVTNSILALQAAFLVAGSLASSTSDSLLEFLVGVGLVYLLAGLDMYLTRPTEPNRTLILPCMLVPFLGFALLFSYVGYRTCLRSTVRRWFVLQEHYIAYYDSNLDSRPRGVFLFDRRTRVQTSWNPRTLHVSNVDKVLSIHFASSDVKARWLFALQQVLGNNQEEQEEGSSSNYFSPRRANVPAQWYSSAKFFYRDLYESFESAKHEIFIAGWMISPELVLVRGEKTIESESTTLETVLGRAVRRGVRVHVLLYRDVEIALPNNSRHAKERLVAQGVQIIRHAAQDRAIAAHSHLIGFRAGSTWWSHHEKIVVVDQRIAFVGGIDLAFGRYDDMHHKLVDTEGSIWRGKDYYNVRVKEFENLGDAYSDLVDRQQVGRMPWHDIHCCVGGGAARDIALHFMARWNRELHQLLSFQSMQKSSYHYLLPAHFPDVEELDKFLPYCCSHVQVLRSVGPWSLSQFVEKSIKLKYIELIQKSNRFIYIENQFFNSMDIATALADRLQRAVEEAQSDFLVIIVLPQWPAFEGMPFDNPATKVVLHYQHQTMDSIFERLTENGVDAEQVSKMIRFYALRKAEFLNDNLISEQVYVHSKLIIVDDEHCIIGSANLNERSLSGSRDSEVCVYIADHMFAKDLRCALFIEHLGLHPDTTCTAGCRLCSLERRSKDCGLPREPLTGVLDPYTASWHDVAQENRIILQSLFPGMQPSDDYVTISSAKRAMANASVLDPVVVARVGQLQGHLVETPRRFLREEKNMLPGVTEPSTFMLPTDNFN